MRWPCDWQAGAMSGNRPPSLVDRILRAGDNGPLRAEEMVLPQSWELALSFLRDLGDNERNDAEVVGTGATGEIERCQENGHALCPMVWRVMSYFCCGRTRSGRKGCLSLTLRARWKARLQSGSMRAPCFRWGLTCSWTSTGLPRFSSRYSTIWASRTGVGRAFLAAWKSRNSGKVLVAEAQR